ncbi:SMI1/KNR4 family protein [Sphaerothrix gracilis]|uniref:SMI1/KNR4 family protein n=1 Tax=Sphaerothrix gracilis TaxID=3151835 RepID=UPI0031FBAECC
MNTFDWKAFLKQWSQEVIETVQEKTALPQQVLEDEWLGYPAASENQILQAEAQLQRSLPPSYREFLMVTNGWRCPTPFIHRILPIESVTWFRVNHSHWIEEFVYRHLSRHQTNAAKNGSSASLDALSDTAYFSYGDHQDCSKLRIQDLWTALEISSKGDASIYLLNPQVVTSGGEWEAWFFSDLLPGADRYRSFLEMMQAEHKNFLELREL